MTDLTNKKRIGYACCYTPLQLIHAAGFVPYRILPLGNYPDQAGRILHDNLCPHVKKIVDRALGNGLPELEGVVFMNSCDAMRRLFDAWRRTNPDMKAHFSDLPATSNEAMKDFFTHELSRLKDILSEWSGKKITDQAIHDGINIYNELSNLLAEAGKLASRGLQGFGYAELQGLYNMAMTGPAGEAISSIRTAIEKSAGTASVSDKTPVFIFGNVLPDPEVFELIESCGARIVGNDLCTGSRMFAPIDGGDKDPLRALAEGLLAKPPCPRTMDPGRVNRVGEYIISSAKEAGARGVIGHTMKFCDPYIMRLPMIRDIAKAGKIPLLLLEGDCTMRSMGQQRTRIEAFIEMVR